MAKNQTREPREGSIKSLSEQDRPREKLTAQGARSLSDAELLAILIGSGTRRQSAVEVCQTLLRTCNHNLELLADRTLKQITSIPGIGPAKAVTIAAALELGRRRKFVRPPSFKISSSHDAFEYIFRYLADMDHERFYVALLRRNNEVIGDPVNISSGGVSGTMVDAKMIFRPALEQLASNIILYHNHPSGNLQPSPADIRLTNKLIKAGNTLDIKVLDHLIIAQDNFYSFNDMGTVSFS